jgi:hypothetical protein
MRPFDVQAELEVGFGAFSERFTSRVEGMPFEMVKVGVKEVGMQRPVILTSVFGRSFSAIDGLSAMFWTMAGDGCRFPTVYGPDHYL